jgi:hypothetical protein
MTTTDPPPNVHALPDASDVVTGPIGSARLRDPASSGPEGADVDRLPTIEDPASDPGLVPTSPGSWSPGYDPNGAVRQLEAIIQNLTTYATPVLREIAARAAELAAKAGEAAGPLAHKAAAMTEEVGGRLAAKGLEVAAELRGGQSDQAGPAAPGPTGEPSTGPAEPSAADQEPHEVEVGLPPRS